jgi:hypothetical protein
LKEINMRIWLVTVCLIGLSVAGEAQAQTYAEPPDGSRYRAHRSYDDWQPPPQPECFDDGWRRRELSIVRLSIGGAGRAQTSEMTPGMMAALDLGRGPAGFRASAMWFHVGSPNGLSQYTGELTLDLGGRGVWRPVVGAGAGLARTGRVDDQGNRTDGGASLGIGLLRAALEYRLPIDGVDSRAGVAVIGILPAVRGDGAPDSKGWVVLTASVGVGF